MKNFENYAAEGKKKIEKNSRYDMQISDYKFVIDKIKEGLDIVDALSLVFHAGVEAGSRIEKKNTAEKCS